MLAPTPTPPLARTLRGRSRVPSIQSLINGPLQKFRTVILGDEYNLTVDYEGKCSELQIIDTAGVEQFSMNMNEGHIQRSVGFVLVFSLTERASLKGLDYIWQQIHQVKSDDENIPIVVVGTKMDLRSERQVSSDMIQKLAQKWGVPVYKASAKSGWHAREVFHDLLWRMRNKYPQGGPQTEREKKGRCIIM
uniref:Protein kinase domain-containing protein n=1 Tax=Ganoderma boninense TaxID=34458 RepID=A0A5K1K411_9APHY|nr:Protein kinase domain-containing protein [Ganoderma boninense]